MPALGLVQNKGIRLCFGDLLDAREMVVLFPYTSNAARLLSVLTFVEHPDVVVALVPGHRCQRELRGDKLEVPCKTAQLKTFFSCTEEKVFCRCLTT